MTQTVNVRAKPDPSDSKICAFQVEEDKKPEVRNIPQSPCMSGLITLS